MTWIPLTNRLLVWVPPPPKIVGQLQLADPYKFQEGMPRKAEVVACGEEASAYVSEGSTVIIGPYAGSQIFLEDEFPLRTKGTFLVIGWEDILLIKSKGEEL